MQGEPQTLGLLPHLCNLVGVTVLDIKRLGTLLEQLLGGDFPSSASRMPGADGLRSWLYEGIRQVSL